jgi:hypothetical protein
MESKQQCKRTYFVIRITYISTSHNGDIRKKENQTPSQTAEKAPADMHTIDHY